MPNKLYILVVSSIFFTISDIFFSISFIFPKISCMYLLDVLDILRQVFCPKRRAIGLWGAREGRSYKKNHYLTNIIMDNE